MNPCTHCGFILSAWSEVGQALAELEGGNQPVSLLAPVGCVSLRKDLQEPLRRGWEMLFTSLTDSLTRAQQGLDPPRSRHLK